MNKTSALITVLVFAVIVLGGVVLWQNGQRACEQRLGPIVETRYVPFRGCYVRLGDEWKSEDEMRNSVQEGVKQMQEGTKKVIEGIFGKDKAK
jgi:hypothetical protein